MGLLRIGRGLVKAACGLFTGDVVFVYEGAKDVGIGVLASLVGGGVKELLDGTSVGEFIDSFDIVS